MLCAVLFIGLVGGSLGADYSEVVPEIVNVIEWSHSAKVAVDRTQVPPGTDRVHIEAKELNDLTGNRFEKGYDFGYSSAVPYFYYPQLNDAKYHVFKLKYGKANRDGVKWSQYSDETHYFHSESSRFSLVNMARDWPMARDQCLQQGKRLAIITSQKMNEMVLKVLREYGAEVAWIGLFDKHYNDHNSRTTWNWVDGSTFRYSNFEYGAEINESTLKSSTVAINSQGEWETRAPTDKITFVCEKGLTEHAKIAEGNVGVREKAVIA